jgi:hypothetical protein
MGDVRPQSLLKHLQHCESGFLKCRNGEYVTRSHRKVSLAFGSIVYHSCGCSWRPGDASGLIRSIGEKVHKERGEVSKSASRYNSPVCRCSPSRPRPCTRSAIDTFLDPRLHVWKKDWKRRGAESTHTKPSVFAVGPGVSCTI